MPLKKKNDSQNEFNFGTKSELCMSNTFISRFFNFTLVVLLWHFTIGPRRKRMRENKLGLNLNPKKFNIHAIIVH